MADVLPDARLVGGDPDALRKRVSRPVLLRATGLGVIEGGELVVVPPARATQVLASLQELVAAGISALVLVPPADEGLPPVPTTGLPVVVLGEEADPRRVQEEIERYIVRRRRELFALDQELHRVLIEAAIGGASTDELLRAAALHTRKQAVLDREGEIIAEPDAAVPRPLLLQGRLATHGSVQEAAQLPGPPPALALPVHTGRDRRGICLIVGVDASSLDEDEAVLTALASACAIALGRERVEGAPALADLLSPAAGIAPELRDDGAPWAALAVEDAGTPTHRLERALALECQARSVPCVVAREGESVVSLVRVEEAFPWEAMVESVRRRLGSGNLRAGVSRKHRGLEGARAASREALVALRQGVTAITRYETIELEVMLARMPGWEPFVRARLGSLLDEGSGSEELRRTLGAYLEAGRNAREAARALHVHRNTLLYRMKRIEETLSVDLDDPDEVFALDLALRVLKAHSASQVQGKPALSAGGGTD